MFDEVLYFLATTNSKKRHLPEDRSLVTYSDVL